MKNKKGIGLEWYLLIVAFILGLAGYYIYLYTSPHKIIDSYIGKYQFNILKTHNIAEDTLLYIDQSSKYSLQQSIYDLAQNGGIVTIAGDEPSSEETYKISDKGCVNYYGYNLWYSENKNCFNENEFKNNLKFLFIKKLNQYLTASPYNIQRDNYEYEIKDDLEIVGKAFFPIEFDILKDETKPAVKKPTEAKVKEQEGFVVFTGTNLCAKGARCLLTKEAYNLLQKAQEIAKQKGVSLEVTSAYRTLEEQNTLWERNPNSQVVCYPSQTCPHVTGKAVDIRIKEKIDWALLHKIMSEAGWIRYAGENLHFECCETIRYAQAKELEKKTGQPVTVIG